MRDPFGNTKLKLNRLTNHELNLIYQEIYLPKKTRTKCKICLLELLKELKIKIETIILSNTLNDRKKRRVDGKIKSCP